jgi:tetratricopeptide (TPR) repeat protein
MMISSVPHPVLAVRRPLLLAASLLSTLLVLDAAPVAGQTPLRALDTGGLETRSAALIFSGQEAGDLAVSALTLPLPGVEGKSRVALIVDLEGASLLEKNEGDTLITEVYAYAFNGEGGLLDTLTQAFRLDLENHREQLLRSGIKFLGHLDLPPGRHTVRLLVLNRQTQRLALQILTVAVPDWSLEEVPTLLTPFFPEAPERWLLVEAAVEPTAPPGLPFPLVVNGRPEVPATRPLIDASASTPLFLLGHHLPRQLHTQITTQQEEEVAELGLGTLESISGGPAGLEMLGAELNPTGLDGRFLLKIAYTVPGAKKKDEPVEIATWTPIIVLPKDILGADTLPVWTELRSRAQSAMGGQSGLSLEELAALRREKRDQARLQQIYRDALRLVAANSRDDGLQAIRALEAQALEKGSSKEMKRLTQSQLGVAQALADRQSGHLLPLIDVHEELYRSYHQNRHFGLSTHSRQMVMHLSETYLKAADDTPQAHSLVACALVSLGGYLYEIGATPSAQKAFEVALEYDEHQEAALLSLAVIHESFGHYDEAVNALRRYQKVYPGRPEARLRLAVNLARLGAKRKAEPLLRRSLQGDNPEWVRVLAYQELARHLTAERQATAAITLLEEAIQEFPQYQRLYLQLASVLDRGGRPREARNILAAMDPRAGRNLDSPRLRYTHMSRRPLLEARQRLSKAADAELAALRDRLRTLATEGK